MQCQDGFGFDKKKKCVKCTTPGCTVCQVDADTCGVVCKVVMILCKNVIAIINLFFFGAVVQEWVWCKR